MLNCLQLILKTLNSGKNIAFEQEVGRCFTAMSLGAWEFGNPSRRA